MYHYDYAFVLHAKSYKETSLILTLLTANNGKINVIAKGAKRYKSNINYHPFTLTNVQLYGSGDLLSVISMESIKYFDIENRLNVGLYLNEILYKMLPSQESDLNIFIHYQTILEVISFVDNLELQRNLRLFEKHLLEVIGYAISFTHETATGVPITAHNNYGYKPDHGLCIVNQVNMTTIRGATCIEYAENLIGEYYKNNAEQILKSLKYFMRYVLGHLSNNTIYARKLEIVY